MAGDGIKYLIETEKVIIKIENASRNGNIEQLSYLDMKYTHALGGDLAKISESSALAGIHNEYFELEKRKRKAEEPHESALVKKIIEETLNKKRKELKK